MYDQESQRTKASRSENLISVFDTNYVYDEIGRLNQIEHKNLSEFFADYSMTYDTASRITSINDAKYSYDSIDQLIGAESDNQAPTKPKIVQKYIYLLALLTIKFNSLTLIFENIRVSSN